MWVYLSFSQQMESYWLCRHVGVFEFLTADGVILVVQTYGVFEFLTVNEVILVVQTYRCN